MRIIGVIVVLILIGMFLWTVTSSSFSVQAELATEAQSVQPGFGTQIQVEDHHQRLPGNSTSSQGSEPLQIPPQEHADDDFAESIEEPSARKTEKKTPAYAEVCRGLRPDSVM